MKGSWTDQLNRTKELFTGYWSARSKKQKWIMIGSFLFIVAALTIFIYFVSRPQYVPLYTGQLSQREVGDIKAELDSQGYTGYQLSENGTMILVPQKDASNLLVTLASAGYPKDNSINYDIFSQNLSFGGTDRQYDILEREAMQNQLAGVLSIVDGIKNAEVILTLPEESVFIRQDQEQTSSASVIVEVEPGAVLDNEQIRALYTLVSRSVPKLTEENITIMNQYSETLTLHDQGNKGLSLDQYEQQRQVQKNIEQDIQQSLQNLLGTVLGTDQVYVHTFIKMNFDQVKTQENLVQPTDDENNGIIISSEESSKNFSGTGDGQNPPVGTGDTDNSPPNYSGATTGGESEYEESQNRVNYEVNRINNEIIKSPYVIEDITINVGVEADPDLPNGLAPEVDENIRNVISNTVRTALSHPDLSQEEIDQRITVFPHSFAGEPQGDATPINNWIYLIAAAVFGLLFIGLVVWWLLRRRKARKEEMEAEDLSLHTPTTMEEQDYFTEQDMDLEQQLKKLLEQRPDDFSKVIKTWLRDEEAK